MNIKKVSLLLFIVSLSGVECVAQPGKESENSIFWQVSGKDLKEPSYLFGTFHLLGNVYVDSLPNVSSTFKKCKTVVGEMLMDSTLAMKILMASQLKGTSIDKLITPQQYKQTADWLKELSGHDLKMFNNLNPITIQVLLMTVMQQKYYPMNSANDMPMDLYFQKEARRTQRKVIGLEPLEVQLKALFGQFSYERQAEMLVEFVSEKEKAHREMVLMNKLYREGRLDQLQELMSKQTYTKEETMILLDNRNREWMNKLPQIMREQSAFIAVGALHLSGPNGLINLLKASGYTVKPMRVK
ncbi:MAG: TraB/GumN family protein [Cyclobacteriaceae bacterium]|nr:TraB/GumN family protein [Cyclobacteriaceae bacterium]